MIREAARAGKLGPSVAGQVEYRSGVKYAVFGPLLGILANTNGGMVGYAGTYVDGDGDRHGFVRSKVGYTTLDVPDAALRLPAASLLVLPIRLTVPLLSVIGPPDRRALLFAPVLLRTIDALLML